MDDRNITKIYYRNKPNIVEKYLIGTEVEQIKYAKSYVHYDVYNMFNGDYFNLFSDQVKIGVLIK